MKDLKIIQAIYYDPKQDYSKGTVVTDELISLIKNDILFYQGIYNNVFPDHFKSVKKKLRIELKYRSTFIEKKYIKIYNEDDKINLPEDLDIKSILKFDLNSPWLVTIIGGIIVVIISSIFFKQPSFIYKYIKIVDSSITNSRNVIFGDQNKQSHTGSGNNISGDKVIINNPNGTSSDTDKKQLYEEDIFVLPNKANGLTTTLEKEIFYNKFNGLLVESKGFITDIYKPGINNFGGKSGVYYQARVDSTEDKKSPNIMCVFDESWGKKLETINIPFEINFNGIVDKVEPGSRVWLIECNLD